METFKTLILDKIYNILSFGEYNSAMVYRDHLIKLGFNNDFSFQMIISLFIQLELEHTIQRNERIILIRRSELDQISTEFQDKILQFEIKDEYSNY